MLPSKQSSKKYLFCNKCRTETNHLCEGDHCRIFKNVNMDELIGFRLWICAGCESGTLEEYYTLNFLDEDGDILGSDEVETHYFPERAQFHVVGKQFKQLPPKLDKIYREVLQSFNNNLEMLCAVGIRALIEGICADQEITGRNLEMKIEGLSNILPRNIVSNLHSLRFMGNEAAHELNRPEQNELRLAIEVCEDLLNFIYELDYKASLLSKVRQDRRNINDSLPKDATDQSGSPRETDSHQ